MRSHLSVDQFLQRYGDGDRQRQFQLYHRGRYVEFNTKKFLVPQDRAN